MLGRGRGGGVGISELAVIEKEEGVDNCLFQKREMYISVVVVNREVIECRGTVVVVVPMVAPNANSRNKKGKQAEPPGGRGGGGAT